MAQLGDKHSASVITALESMQASWERAADDSERQRIKDFISKAVSELTDEQLAAYIEYQKERIRQAEHFIEQAKKIVQEAEKKT